MPTRPARSRGARTNLGSAPQTQTEAPKRDYRMLSLDGGGAWSLIQVRALTALYNANTTGHTILSDFDLVAANSGGSLVLAGLVEDLKLSDVLGYFEDETLRRSIFSSTRKFGDRALRDLTGLGPKYSAEAKLPVLQSLLPKSGNLPLPSAVAGIRRAGAAADVHLLISGFDYDRNRASFFRSAPASGPSWGKGQTASVRLAEAVHASTNAPVNYFDEPAQFPDRPERYWDGGITGCNNPVQAAVTEALVLGQTPTDIIALSLGTATVALPWPQPGQPPSPFTQKPTDQSLVNDLHKLATTILDDPPDIATFLAHVMTGGNSGLTAPVQSRIVRMNPLISPVKDGAGNWQAPGNMTAAQFMFLANLDLDAVQQHEVDAIAAYADLWLQNNAPNQPIRMNRDTLQLELGYPSFQAAAAVWQSLKAGTAVKRAVPTA
jgi:Patatin-like phospholipase